MRDTTITAIPPSVDAFLACIEGMPASAWLAIGRGDDAVRDRAALSTAELIRDATIAAASLDVTAWLVRDAVWTLAWLARRRLPTPRRRERGLVAHAHRRIERVALALLVRDQLPASDLRVLCRGVEAALRPEPAAAPPGRAEPWAFPDAAGSGE